MNQTQGKKTIADPEIYMQTRHRDQQYKRVAALLVILTGEQRLKILNGLSPEENRQMIAEIAITAEQTPKMVKRVLEEFDYYPAKINPNRGNL